MSLRELIYTVSLKKKLYILFGGIITATLFGMLVGTAAFSQVQVGGATYNEIEQSMLIADNLAKMRANAAFLRSALLSLILAETESDRESLISDIGSLTSRIDDLFEEVDGGMKTTGDSEALKNIHTAREAWSSFKQFTDSAFLPAVRAARTKEAFATTQGPLLQFYDAYTTETKAAVDHVRADVPIKVVKIKKESRLVKILFVCGGIIFVAFYIVVAVFMTRTLISPVLLIADRSRLMAEGDFTRSAMRARGSDEIGAMISSFGSMAGKVSDTVETLKMGINNLSSSSEVLSTTAEELSKAASRQTVRAKEVSAATAQMSLTVSDVARNAVQAADAAKHSSEAAAGGKKIVAMTAERLSLITRTVQESLQTIEALSESSGQIGEIVNLIHTIADQTNLLALNAAIEAARAGEQGRGFAVVADEVRKLADKTATATRDIEQRISSIRTEAQNSLAAIKKGGSEVEKGMDLARSASEALDVIVQSSTQVLDMIQRIAASTEEQSASSEQIKRTMLEISSSVDHSSNASEQIQQSSGNLARLASEIGVMMAWFKTKNGLPASSETVSEQALSTTKPVVHAALVAP